MVGAIPGMDERRWQEMNEAEIREALAEIDDKRARAQLLDRIAGWPMGVPSEIRADKQRGWFASIWKGHGETVMGEVVLTRDERSELCDWMRAKATRLAHEADPLHLQHLLVGEDKTWTSSKQATGSKLSGSNVGWVSGRWQIRFPSGASTTQRL